jgi:hypothetical protein
MDRTDHDDNSADSEAPGTRLLDPVHLVAYLTHHERHHSASRLYAGTVPEGWLIEIRDESLPLSPTTCGREGHFATQAPTAVWKSSALHTLDCPCDVPCSFCQAAVGSVCKTPSGMIAKESRRQRITASPRCQGLIAGTRSQCDLGDHDWRPRRDVKFARCLGCGREEPIQPE